MDTKSDGCSGKCENRDKVGHNVTLTTRNEQCSGCGLNNSNKITITVAPTTGGRFELSINKTLSIENLKKLISKKLKVPKERILLLNKDRQLREGNLEDHSICEGSTVTLLPSVETGLLSQRPEQGVMQALESLNDAQVNDFLSGKSPLNLTMRLGDHMMLIQLQLSSVTSSTSKKANSASATLPKNTVINSESSNASDVNSTTSETPCNSNNETQNDCSDFYSKINNIIHKNFKLKRKYNELINKAEISETTPPKKLKSEEEAKNLPSSSKLNELLSTSTTSTTATSTSSTASMSAPDPVSLRLPPDTTISSASGAATADTAPIDAAPTTGDATSQNVPSTSTQSTNVKEKPCCSSKCKESPTLDTKALAEASRNLTQTLKQLSSEVLTCRTENLEETPSTSTATPRRRTNSQGAIIESMKHHGKGVFSGTFSGTLNPALQDRFGRPKRDISTIIHILNDLLCATPQYRRHQSQAKPQTQETTTANEGISSTDLSSVENEATRGKLEKLRMVMEQNRARRKARREARLPCTSLWSQQLNDEDMDGAKDANELIDLTCSEILA